ncbi:MAG: 1-acyl-sn-glycerol-3-phosphate acyltransferase [wastewater metagenome]|nr:1-acyl-sn-glycerol-3-phosphate acyltransferase [Candidatus Loosdrechtia aerotolerans]
MDENLQRDNNISLPVQKKSMKVYVITRNMYHRLQNLLINCFFYALKILGIVLFILFFRIRVKNTDRIPRTGPLIIAANHFSYIDPVALQIVFPRHISFMMTERFYKGHGKWFFKLFRAICIRGKGMNIAALKEGIHVLKENGVLGIFPEGGVSKEGRFQKGIPGIGYLAMKSNVPVLPVFLAGTYRVLPKGKIVPRPSRITIIYGNPMIFDTTKSTANKEKIVEITEEIMEEIKKLSDPEK